MNKNVNAVVCALAFFVVVGLFVARAQSADVAPRFEVALATWIGEDEVSVISGGETRTWHPIREGAQTPTGAPIRESCLAWSANRLAMEGWEPVNLDSDRILFRRRVIR